MLFGFMKLMEQSYLGFLTYPSQKVTMTQSSVYYIFESTSAGVRYQDGQGEPGHEDFETAPASGFFR